MISSERRDSLLEAMASLGMETSAKTFLVPRGVTRILDPAVVVVLGARGSGKSALARFLVEAMPGATDNRYELLRSFGAPPGFSFEAFSQASTHHPDASVLDDFVRRAGDEDLRNFWLVRLVLRLTDSASRIPGFTGHVDKPEEVMKAIEYDRWAEGEINKNLDIVISLPSAERARLIAQLDQGEKSLTAGFVTAVYDDLDAIGSFDPTLRARFIRALLAMWSSLSTRYRHLRAKIFLPADLFDTRQLDTVDGSKLLARAERIEWDAVSLYRLVLRHLAQQGEDTRAWLGEFGLRFDDLGPDLGWMPVDVTEEAVARWLGDSLHPIMDVNGTRDYVQHWILNRLRDGRDRVSPRTLLGFFRGAAKAALHRLPTTHSGRLLDTSDAIDAIQQAGSDRVAEIRGIYEWVDRLGALRGRLVPLPRNEVEQLMATDPDNVPRPTGTRDGRTVTEELLRLGMLRDLGVDDLLDVPDVFINYFGALRIAAPP
jgi:hypothetical protein